MPKKFVVVTFEACFEIGSDISRALQSGVDDLRNNAEAARITEFRVLEDREAYEVWYRDSNQVHEMELPSPGTITVSFD